MKKYLYISLFLTMFLLASATKSFACSCMVTPEPEKKQVQNAYSGANAIFSGEVVEIKESPTSKSDLIVKFKIAKSWKGASIREITVSTAKDSAMCGFNFEAGKKYLVYAFGKSEELSTTNCSRTALLGKKSDAKYLDKLKKRERKS